jgi:hypothetical protein
MDKFLELQAVMWRTNAGLTDTLMIPDPTIGLGLEGES